MLYLLYILFSSRQIWKILYNFVVQCTSKKAQLYSTHLPKVVKLFCYPTSDGIRKWIWYSCTAAYYICITTDCRWYIGIGTVYLPYIVVSTAAHYPPGTEKLYPPSCRWYSYSEPSKTFLMMNVQDSVFQLFERYVIVQLHILLIRLITS